MGNTQAGGAQTRLPSPGEIKAIQSIQDKLYTAYNEEKHAVLLQLLWNLGGFTETFKRTGSEWKTLGFQHVDPITDLRGAGVLGLENLISFLQDEPAAANIMSVRKDRTSLGENYPWAAAGINITRMLCEILEVIKPSGAKNDRYGQEARPFWHLCTSEAHFNRFYAYAFVMLDEIWTSEKATYMQFPRVLQLTRARLHHIITQDQAQLPSALQAPGPALPVAPTSSGDATPSCTYYSAAVVPSETEAAGEKCHHYHYNQKENDRGRGSGSFASRREEEEAMRCMAAKKQREEYERRRSSSSSRNSRTFSV